MNTKLGYKKGTGGFKPFLSCSLLQQFVRNVYIKLLSVCNSTSPLHPRLASAPNHPQDPIRWGKWEELAEARALCHFGRLVSGQRICERISAQTSWSWNLFVSCTHGRSPQLDCEIPQCKTTTPQRSLSFSGQALRNGEVSVRGRERDSQRQVGVIAENKSLLGLSGFFPCPHYPGPEYSPSPRLCQTPFKNWFN